jgi:hypothetical protein
MSYVVLLSGQTGTSKKQLLLLPEEAQHLGCIFSDNSKQESRQLRRSQSVLNKEAFDNEFVLVQQMRCSYARYYDNRRL